MIDFVWKIILEQIIFLLYEPQKINLLRSLLLIGFSYNFFVSIESVNFLIADGKKFVHPLAHLEKTIDDLPVLAIDSFRHMYIFPDFQDIYKPGKLRKFVDDLHSGKLHREFHYGPEPEEKSESESKPVEHEPSDHPHDVKSDESQMDVEDETPPDSTFIKLAPSDKRYTLVRNEL